MHRSAERARGELAQRLRQRAPEIEEAILARVEAFGSPGDIGDPEYVRGFRATVATGLEYALEAVERGEEMQSPVPVLLLAQTRLAARNGITLDTVLRRYFAGYTLINDFIVQEAETVSLRKSCLQQLLRDRAMTFDRLLAAITDEYQREPRAGPYTSEERRVARVRALLEGEMLDPSELSYPFGGQHIAAAASGREAEAILRELAGTLDRALLLVRPATDRVWAWFGGRDSVPVIDLVRRVEGSAGSGVVVAFGQPGEGIAGWRFTHRQALAAFRVALEGNDPVVRYDDVGLLAAVLHDDLLADSLRYRYFPSLAGATGEGLSTRDTLRAYFESGRNVSSAAVSINASRRTVANRLRNVEEQLDVSLSGHTAELELALRLLDFEESRAVEGIGSTSSEAPLPALALPGQP